MNELIKKIFKPIWLPYKRRVLDRIEEILEGQKRIENYLSEQQIKSDGYLKPGNLLYNSWNSSLHHEYKFWEKIIKEYSLNESGREYISYKNANFPNGIVELLPRNKKEYDVLDVGCGPRSWLGNSIPGKKVNLVCCDPLAEKYIEYLNKYDLPIIVRPIAIECEKLIEKFSFNQFDIVTARNCLDHAYSPELCILQMLLVSKNCVYLLHSMNEGKNAKYQGLHQWDFYLEDNDFIIDRKHGERINFSRKYSHLFRMEAGIIRQDGKEISQDWLEIILYKKQ